VSVCESEREAKTGGGRTCGAYQVFFSMCAATSGANAIKLKTS